MPISIAHFVMGDRGAAEVERVSPKTKKPNFVEEFARAFTWQHGQIGAAFAIGGNVVGVDAFDHPAVMRRFLGKLVRVYALDVKDAPNDSNTPATFDSLKSFLAKVGDAQISSEHALGLGKDVRFLASQICGAARLAEGRYVHICAFAQIENPRPGSFWNPFKQIDAATWI